MANGKEEVPMRRQRHIPSASSAAREIARVPCGSCLPAVTRFDGRACGSQARSASWRSRKRARQCPSASARTLRCRSGNRRPVASADSRGPAAAILRISLSRGGAQRVAKGLCCSGGRVGLLGCWGCSFGLTDSDYSRIHHYAAPATLVYPSQTDTRTRAHTHAHKHTHARARTHTHTHTTNAPRVARSHPVPFLSLSVFLDRTPFLAPLLGAPCRPALSSDLACLVQELVLGEGGGIRA